MQEIGMTRLRAVDGRGSRSTRASFFLHGSGCRVEDVHRIIANLCSYLPREGLGTVVYTLQGILGF